jgi:uncharacterized protein (TIGR02145 family)
MKKIIVLMIAGFMLVSCDPQENPDPDEVVVSESAQIIEDQTWDENILLIDSTNYTLTFREDLIALLPLEIGDVLVSTVGNGLLRKITGITSTKGGGEIIVETDFASLTDVIEQGTIQAEVVLTPDDIQEVVFHYDGITPEPANVKGSVNHVTNWNINTELYSGVRLTGQFVSDMTFILDINVAGSSLNSAKSGIIMSETLTLQLSAALEREFDKDITIATITFAPIIIPVVGPLALVIVPKVEVKLGLEGSVGGTVTCSATQEIFIDAGIQYAKASGWSDYKTFTNEFSNTTPVLEKANADASVYIQPELSTKLYNVAGPYVNTKIYGKLEIDADEETVEKEEPWWKLSVGINLNAGMNVEIFDLATLNYEKSNIIGYEWLIAQSPTKPKVTTGDVTNIQSTTASCSGNVTADGGQAVTDRGICWSTSQNPTIENSKTSGGTGTGTFTGNLTGLAANTSYYVRAYATNSEGTAYGAEKAFTTLTEGADFAVTTGAVTNITTNSASCSGNVTAEDAASVTARGLCWSTSQNPTTADSKTTNGTGTGTFSGSLTGLNPNTTYYVRAYATRSEGTTYGEERSFQTLEEEELSGTFTDNRDGKTYNYITIGNQVWMAQNLAYLPAVSTPSLGSSNGTVSGGGLSDLLTKYYYVYGYEGSDVTAAKATANYQTYGVLYNFPAAEDYYYSSTPPSGQGICPSGWHLPDNEEWIQLINYLGGQESEDNPGWYFNVGVKMMETGFVHWIDHTGCPDASNESGFTALPGGYRFEGGWFFGMGYSAIFWSYSHGTNTASHWNIDYTGDLRISASYYNAGYSVRCIKD